MELETIWELMQQGALVGDVVRSCFGISAMYGVISFIHNHLYKTVKLSIGSFKVKYKDYNVQNITNIVSANFYEGDQVPPSIRKEIILLTCPKVKKMKSNE